MAIETALKAKLEQRAAAREASARSQPRGREFADGRQRGACAGDEVGGGKLRAEWASGEAPPKAVTWAPPADKPSLTRARSKAAAGSPAAPGPTVARALEAGMAAMLLVNFVEMTSVDSLSLAGFQVIHSLQVGFSLEKEPERKRVLENEKRLSDVKL